MAYPIYTTPGLIVSSYKSGEADKLLHIFTRDLGMVFVKAVGIRKLESKLRGHIQDYSLGLFSFVQGKGGWRLVNSDTLEDLASFGYSHNQLQALSKISALLKRVYVGEEPHEKLFEIVVSFIDHPLFCFESDLRLWEIVVGSHIMNILGYVKTDSLPGRVVAMEFMPDMTFLENHKGDISREINTLLTGSQL